MTVREAIQKLQEVPEEYQDSPFVCWSNYHQQYIELEEIITHVKFCKKQVRVQ